MIEPAMVSSEEVHNEVARGVSRVQHEFACIASGMTDGVGGRSEAITYVTECLVGAMFGKLSSQSHAPNRPSSHDSGTAHACTQFSASAPTIGMLCRRGNCGDICNGRFWVPTTPGAVTGAFSGGGKRRGGATLDAAIVWERGDGNEHRLTNLRDKRHFDGNELIWVLRVRDVHRGASTARWHGHRQRGPRQHNKRRCRRVFARQTDIAHLATVEIFLLHLFKIVLVARPAVLESGFGGARPVRTLQDVVLLKRVILPRAAKSHLKIRRHGGILLRSLHTSGWSCP
mmetsp:Transcript_13382/g.35955  ORF Transcript_13382/g.35955 Transcript_13382/m.35955 type:complete len:286 (+) Transcript_13382:92-949(+)